MLANQDLDFDEQNANSDDEAAEVKINKKIKKVQMYDTWPDSFHNYNKS